MPELTPLSVALWIVGPLLQGALAVLLWKRGWHQSHPIFFAFILFNTARAPLLYVNYRLGPAPYFYSYWAVETASLVLGLAVIYELFRAVFEPYPALQRTGLLLFRWAGTGLLVLAVVAAMTQPGVESVAVSAGVAVLDRSLRLVQVGLLVLLLVATRYLGLAWRSAAFGIGLGFGIFGAVQLVAVALWAQIGIPSHSLLSLAKPASYLGAVLLWLWYAAAWRPQEVAVSGPLPRRAELERWNQALLELLQR